jgi:hypothetical protein
MIYGITTTIQTYNGTEVSCCDCGEFKVWNENNFNLDFRKQHPAKLLACSDCTYKRMLRDSLRRSFSEVVEGFVYFVYFKHPVRASYGEYIKIGWTTNLETRMQSHFRGKNSKQYTGEAAFLGCFYGVKSDEADTHWLFDHLKKKKQPGSTRSPEHFLVSPEILDFIEQVTDIPNGLRYPTMKTIELRSSREDKAS